MADQNRLAPINRNKLRDADGSYYYAPAQPTFDVMQQVAIPDYVLREINGPRSSFINYATPNVANINTNKYFNPNPEFSKAHEIQHQIEGLNKQQGKTTNKYAINAAWNENAKELGYDGTKAEEYLKSLLAQPEVQAYFKKLGADPASRILDPKKNPLYEVLADLSAWETTNKQDMLANPVLAKYVFKDPKIAQLVKSTTGMSGVTVGDSDYTPYSLEAAKAWGYLSPPSRLDKIKRFFTK
jgi:hypothetical protein